MKSLDTVMGCACCAAVSRRQFLEAGCAACAAAVPAVAPAISPARAADGPAAGKPKVRVIYALHAVKQGQPDWPNVGFDFAPVMSNTLAALRQGCPTVEFVESRAAGPDQARKLVEADKTTGVDGYLVVQLNCWNQVVQAAAATGKPTLYADFQFGGSGGFLVYTAGFLRQKAPNVAFVASSKPEDLVAAARCFATARTNPAGFREAVARLRIAGTPPCGPEPCLPDPLAAAPPEECRRRMRASKILAVGGGWPGIAPAIHKEMGIEVVNVPFAELNEAWKAANPDEAKALAARWRQGAEQVAGIADATLQASAAMYLAQKAVLQKHAANAITINCLGGFYGGHIHAYPCLGFHQLLNEGLIGACECDLRSSATMVAMTALTGGRPGFISDPVIDTARRRIIYAHCVASNRAFGPQGKANPYQVLTHSEDRQGASVRSLLPVGYMTTTVEFAPERKTVLLHRGKAVANVIDDRACRTKLAVEPVGDLEKLFGEWDQWGWHRVTYYGDLKEPVLALADALGWKVLQEA